MCARGQGPVPAPGLRSQHAPLLALFEAEITASLRTFPVVSKIKCLINATISNVMHAVAYNMILISKRYSKTGKNSLLFHLARPKRPRTHTSQFAAGF